MEPKYVVGDRLLSDRNDKRYFIVINKGKQSYTLNSYNKIDNTLQDSINYEIKDLDMREYVYLDKEYIWNKQLKELLE